jgi:hypothetical protein
MGTAPVASQPASGQPRRRLNTKKERSTHVSPAAARALTRRKFVASARTHARSLALAFVARTLMFYLASCSLIWLPYELTKMRELSS